MIPANEGTRSCEKLHFHAARPANPAKPTCNSISCALAVLLARVFTGR